MILKAFRVQKYKGVIDSGWVEVERLTSLVGKNESGKTSLLRALHKLNPYSPDPYVMAREWPRGHRRDQREEQVVCTARFVLDPSEAADLGNMTDQQVEIGAIVDITRDYAGRLEVRFQGGAFPDRLHPNDVDGLCAALPNVKESVGGSFRERAEACGEEARRLAREGRYSELAKLHKQHTKLLTEAMNAADQAQQQSEQEFIGQYTAKLQEIAKTLSAAPSIQKRAHEYIVKRLPTFIYMDDYRAFTGAAMLNEVKSRREKNSLRPEDGTFLTILALSGLDLDELVRQGEEQDREQRQYDLDDAAKTLTNEVQHRLKQRQYKIEFRVDGNQFLTMVTDNVNSALIRLEERSKGFQWFFSFDLMFMHESKGTFRDCVILLDEPGLHLHPGAQKDFLARLEDYAKDNTLIYTTHLPFMLDLRHPERIRVISETENGTVVSDDLTSSEPDAKLTLQAAMGISGSQSYCVSARNLIVEGADDFYILTELSNLIVRAGSPGIPDDVLITAAGGASEAAYIATFMIGQGLEVVVLVDSDQAGENARDQLVKKWLTRYKGTNAQVLRLGEVVGEPDGDFSVEDLFPEDFYVARARAAYERQISAARGELRLAPGGQLCKRVARAFQDIGIAFNKGSVAKIVRRDLLRMKDAGDLPPETRDKGGKLIDAIRTAFGHGAG